MAAFGFVWLFCVAPVYYEMESVAQVYYRMVLRRTKVVSLACWKWWTNAVTMVLEKFFRRSKEQTLNEYMAHLLVRGGRQIVEF
ncbi:unnamed protein product [Trifolium pratense]|uniref:Uncharacterized protein n=1 Tax=Trifolium pratense TaxID=57577 RepID=A0ACB0M0B4_TRIPR|nr:unnamed protein product [Trifolium pratense]